MSTRSWRDLFSDRLWTIDTEGMSAAWRRFVQFIKLARLTVSTFTKNRMGFQCVALSYFVALSIVPFVALLFALSGGLGMTDHVTQLAHAIFTDRQDLVDMVIDKAGNIINVAKSGTVGLISALMFLWAIFWLMFQVERVFNNVWGILKPPRKLYTRIGFYTLAIFLAPFLVLIFGAGIAYYANITNWIGLDLSQLKVLPKLLGWGIFYIIAVFTLSAMYKWIPAAKVKYSLALKAAALAGIVFTLFQYLYLNTQVFVTRLNDVYGVIAAFPLFLIYLNFSWQIIIYGAELTYALHNVNDYKREA
ncbi:MAG: YihY/virulence factor BrkB family protein [Bacteroidales bacterium]|nr:YihY/virulence factor BrkB family protein [Bacteroidales bacterium]